MDHGGIDGINHKGKKGTDGIDHVGVDCINCEGGGIIGGED